MTTQDNGSHFVNLYGYFQPVSTSSHLECQWVRMGGYEVSTQGDRRFSALVATLEDGRSIEQHYQCDCKQYSPGGTDWRLGKGRPGLDPSIDLWEAYLELWRMWACNHVPLLQELLIALVPCKGCLSDSFARTPINQARALAIILNDYQNQGLIRLPSTV